MNEDEIVIKGKIFVFNPYGECPDCDLYVHKGKKNPFGVKDCTSIPCCQKTRKDEQYGNFKQKQYLRDN